MESRRKRSRSQRLKWGCYILLLVVCTVLQTMPGLFQFGAAKPLWLLPLCLAVSAAELDVFNTNIHQSLSCFQCSPRNVRCDVSVWQFQQRIVFVWRLLLHNIGTICFKMLLLQCRSYGFFVDKCATSCIYQYSSRTHLCQYVFIYHVCILLCQRAMERNNVGGMIESFQCGLANPLG